MPVKPCPSCGYVIINPTQPCSSCGRSLQPDTGQSMPVYGFSPHFDFNFMGVQNDIRIMNDCIAILATSKHIETVVSRYRVLLDALMRLTQHEDDPTVSFPGELPSIVLARIQGEKAQIMTAAIQRAYDDMLKKCATLKTEKGRNKHHLKFFDTLMAYSEYFPSETSDFINSLRSGSKKTDEKVVTVHG